MLSKILRITMKKLLMTTLILTTPLLLTASEYIIKTGALSVNDTISKIEEIVEAKAKAGLSVFTIIDHKKGANKVSMKLPNTKVILFGNPNVGTKVMQKDPLTALDLPMKVLVYDDKGTTKIVYRDPKVWSTHFDLRSCGMVDKMSKAMNAITSKAAEK